MPWSCPVCCGTNSDELIRCVCGYTHAISGEFPAQEKGTGTEPSPRLKHCGSCNKEVPIVDKFCTYCGKSTATLTAEEKKKIKSASKWILALAIIFFAFGTGIGYLQKTTADTALNNLSEYEDSHVWETPIDGETYTVGELKQQINLEVILVFATNYFLAIVMFVLFLWSRKAPFPAMITALCIYLAVIVLNGIIDPKTIGQGVILKIIFISALVAGIKASLVARGISQEQLRS